AEEQKRDRFQQSFNANWFVEERLVCRQCPLLIEEAVAMTGEVQDLHIWVSAPKEAAKLIARHERHHQVDDTQVKGGLSVCDLKSLRAISGHRDFITGIPEHS